MGHIVTINYKINVGASDVIHTNSIDKKSELFTNNNKSIGIGNLEKIKTYK